MENIKHASYYAKKIVDESRHKFVYSYINNRTQLINELYKYPIMIGNSSCALYYNIDGLPKLDYNTSELDKTAISIICSEYFSFSIASELISSIIVNNNFEIIKQLEHILLAYVNRIMSKRSINVVSINELLQLLRETKAIYYDTYCNYLQKGILLDQIDKTPFDFIELTDFIDYVKQMLGKETHISLVLNHNNEVCLESYRVINNLVASRINADISVNILTEPDSWKSYIAQNGQIIEPVHDYENVDYDESSKEYLKRMKRLYQR